MDKLDSDGTTNGANDEVDDSIRKDGDNKANDGIHDGIFGVSNFFAIAARDNIAKTANDEHDDGDDTYGEKYSVGDFCKDAASPDQICRHAVGASSFGACLSGIVVIHSGHSPTGHESRHSGGASKNLPCFF